MLPCEGRAREPAGAETVSGEHEDTAQNAPGSGVSVFSGESQSPFPVLERTVLKVVRE